MPSTQSKRRATWTRPGRIALVLAGLAACGAAGFALRHHALHGQATNDPSSQSAGWRPQWTPGLEYTFAFAWSGETHAVITAGSATKVDVTYDVAGNLVAQAGTLGGRTVLELRLEGLTRHSLKALGVSAVPTDDDAQTLLGQPRAWALIDDAGAIAHLRFAPTASPTFRETMTKLVEQMQVSPAGDGRSDWSATEPGPNGRADAMYHADGLALSRVRVRYESLSALASGTCAACDQHLTDRADITLDPRGVVGALEDEESFRLSQQQPSGDVLDATNKFSLRLVQVAKASRDGDPIAAGAEERTPGDRATMTTEDQRAVLEHEAAGFTPSSLDYAITLFATKGERVQDKTWLTHARAYLLLHPEAVEELGQKLAAEDVAGRGRDMMMQILAVTGSPRAQEILRSSLDSAAGTDPIVLGRLMQKLGVVAHPTEDTIAYAHDAYGNARTHGDRTMALSDAATLGAMAAKVSKTDPNAAKRIVSELQGDLRGARSPEDKRGLLLALRNTGSVTDVDADVRGFASDDSPSVRAEAARTLGSDPTSDARATLRTLATDPQDTVATLALQSLDRDGPTADDVHALAASVLGGQTAQTLDGNVMDFFAGHLDDADDARTVLTFILARTKTPALARRVRALLEQLAS